jgi:hypothetical protein
MKKLLLMLILLNIMIMLCISQITEDKRDANQKYLDRYTAGIKIFDDNELLKEKIIKILKAKEHTYRTIFDDLVTSINEDYSQISELSKYQNKIIYLMLINLKDTAFVNKIGQIIKEDVENIYSESGGIIRFTKDGKIYLRCSKSDAEYQHDEIYNDSYYLSQKEDSLPKIGYFHLHATTYNETPYAGPGSSDIIHASLLYKCNMVNEFVITSLEKGKFNIDYYGIDKREGIVGLLYKNDDVKVIDLGNYYYK